jgi:hypothetical protein
VTKHRPSPVAYEFRVGIAVLDRILSGDIEACPLCRELAGAHSASCVIGQAILNSPLIARRAAGAKARRGR